MAKSEIFAQGDWIVHAYYGLGKVEGVERRCFDGKERVYYRVESGDTTFWVDVKKANTKRVRRVASIKKMKKAIRTLENKPNKLSGNYNKLQKYIKEVRSNASLIPVAELVRDLALRKSNKKLNAYEKFALEDLEERIIQEWSLVMGVKREKVRTKLEMILASKATP